MITCPTVPVTDPCSVQFYVTDCLHTCVKKGKERGWMFTDARHITSKDHEKFITRFNLGHVTYTSTPHGRSMKYEIWDLEPHTAYDAYGNGQHSGNMWKNDNNNFCGVVAPVVVVFKQKYKNDKCPEKTSTQCRVNTMRWNGKEVVLAAFKGAAGKKGKTTKSRTLARNHIWRSNEEGVTEDIRQLREGAWKVTSKLRCLASLAAIKNPGSDFAMDKAQLFLTKLLLELQNLRAKVPCKCEESKCKCSCEEMEQRATVSAMLDSGDCDAKLCEEGFAKKARTDSIHGIVFHPGTACSGGHGCDNSRGPIVGWRFHCDTCNMDFCENRRCIAVHDLDHKLTLIRSPPAVLQDAPEHVAALTQTWAVNCILDRSKLRRVAGQPQKYQYLISWEGKNIGNTWETEESLGNPELVAACHAQFAKRQKRGRDETRCASAV